MTTILRWAGILADVRLPDRVYVDGRAVHAWSAAFDAGRPLPPLDTSRQQALAACYRDWRATSSLTFAEIEEPILSYRLNYMGVLDRCTPGVLDIKTGAPAAWHALQLAAYAMLLDPVDYLIVPRWVLYLRVDRPARLVRHTAALDFIAWTAALRRAQHADHQEDHAARADTATPAPSGGTDRTQAPCP